jgi:hypothetical protein
MMVVMAVVEGALHLIETLRYERGACQQGGLRRAVIGRRMMRCGRDTRSRQLRCYGLDSLRLHGQSALAA